MRVRGGLAEITEAETDEGRTTVPNVPAGATRQTMACADSLDAGVERASVDAAVPLDLHENPILPPLRQPERE